MMNYLRKLIDRFDRRRLWELSVLFPGRRLHLPLVGVHPRRLLHSDRNKMWAPIEMEPLVVEPIRLLAGGRKEAPCRYRNAGNT